MTINAEHIARSLGQGKESRLGDGGWKTCCPGHDDKQASLSVRDSRGKILVRCHSGCTQDHVIKSLQDMDLWPKSEKRRRPSWTPITPVPEGVPLPKDTTHYKLGKPVRHWTYRDADGALIGFIYRFEDSNGKTLLPLSYCKSDEGKFDWVWKSFDKPRPLYNLDKLAARPNDPVLVLEGEKAADAAQERFPNYVCVSWPGGAKAVRYVDVKPLFGRDITLWPDADQPGHDCMNMLAEILIAEGSTKPKLVAVPEGLPKGWDIADDIPEGVDPGKMLSVTYEFEPGGDQTIAQINKRYALVLVGGRAAVLRETYDKETGKTDITYLSTEAFKQFYSNVFVQVGRKEMPLGPYWLSHEDRRTYEGITFNPGRESPNMYNLWRGFSYEPDPTGDWSIFKEHLFENAALGDEKIYNWIFGWFADMFQKPWRKTGTSISFRGRQGTGKTIIGKIFGRLMHQHYTLVDDNRYVFGNFNSHMASTILLHSDEAFWGGDPKHVGKLRSMVTSDQQFIEYKGRDPVPVANYMRLLITTNQDWVVPAASEERRFAVFDMGNAREQQRSYFVEMLRQLRDGGYGGLLHELLNFDLKSVDIGQIPETAALRDQKETSMSDVAKFWFNCLMEGEAIPGQPVGWPDSLLMHRVYDAFIESATKWGVRYKPTSNEFFTELSKYLPGKEVNRICKMSNGKLTWFFGYPDLDKARAVMDELYGTKFNWLNRRETQPTTSSSQGPETLNFGDEEIPF